MQLIKYLLLAAFTSTAISLDPNHPATHLKTVTNGAKTIQTALENYNGGFIESVKLASTIQKAHEASVATRKIMEGYERFSDADGRDTIDEYHKLHPHVIDGLRIVEEKAAVFQSAGYMNIAQKLLLGWHAEKNKLKDVMKEKLLEDHFDEIAEYTALVDEAFVSSINVFQNVGI